MRRVLFVSEYELLFFSAEDIKASITEPINVYEMFMNHGTYYVRIIKIPHY